MIVDIVLGHFLPNTKRVMDIFAALGGFPEGEPQRQIPTWAVDRNRGAVVLMAYRDQTEQGPR